jgi:hypothetical protein
VPAERVLTRGELNRALLARQLLLRRGRLSVPRTIERLGALQAQWPPSPYLALWSRIQGFRRARLAAAVERGQVVKATLMRTTLHHVSARDYLAYAGLILSQHVASAERRLARNADRGEIARLVRELKRYAAEMPRKRPELLELLGQPRLVSDERMSWVVWHFLASSAALVQGPSGSVWRQHTAGGTFVPAATWLGGEGATGRPAAEHLARRYLAAFGPATRADLAQWTGLPLGLLQDGIAALKLRRFRDEHGRVLLDLPRMPLPPPKTEAPARLLPKWDSILIAHVDRTRILPEGYRSEVIRGGDIQPTFLVNGFVAGTWRADGDRVELSPFGRLRAGDKEQLEDEATALSRFLAETV